MTTTSIPESARGPVARLRNEQPRHATELLSHPPRTESETDMPSIETVEVRASRPVRPEPIDRADADVTNPSLLQLFEMILKGPRRLETIVRRPDLQPQLIPRFLALACLSFMLFGVALAVVIAASGVSPQLTAMQDVIEHDAPLIRFNKVENATILGRSSAALPIIVAYVFGLIATTGVCLPSLYFYGLLSGVKLSMLDCVSHAMKAKANTAVAMVGILPIYVAISMGALIFRDSLPRVCLEWALWLGFILPFLAGVWGTSSLYRGFAGLADTLPPDRCERRGCFLRRLVASWGACYTAVAPVMIFTIWQSLQAVMQ